MIRLVLKDIFLLKKTLMYCLLYVIFFIIAFQNFGEASFTSLLVALNYMLILTVCAYDDKNKSDVVLNSLPVKKSSIVMSKYVLVYLVVAAGTVVYSLAVALINFLGIPIKTYGVSLPGFLTALAAVTVMTGIYFPIFFKYGYIKSRVFNFAMFFAFFFGMALLADFLNKNKDDAFVGAFLNFFENLTHLQLAITVAVVVLVIAAVSYLLSLKFYKNREF